MRSSTLQDLADELGVARSTVSRALRDDPQIAAPTRQRIQRLAHDRNYRPNAAARALNRRASGVIGVVMPRSAPFVFANPYFTELLAGVAHGAEHAGYPLMLSASPTPDYTRWLQEGRVDGLIALGHALSAAQRTSLERLAAAGAAIVLVGQPATPTSLDAVTVDEQPGIDAAAVRAAELGHRRAAIIAGPARAAYAEHRTDAWRRALARNGIELCHTLHGDDTHAGGYAAAARVLELADTVSLWCIGNDLMALGALACLTQHRRSVPGDVSIIGFDDIAPASVAGLASVRQPTHELGRHALDRLIAKLHGEPPPEQRFQSTYVERASCGPAPRLEPK